MIDRAQKQQNWQQEFGLRQQEFGLQNQASQRADRQQTMEFNKAAVEAYDKQIGQLEELSRAAYYRGDEAAMREIDSHANDLRSAQAGRYSVMIDGPVQDGVTRTMSNAAALKRGADPHSMSDDDFSDVYSLALGGHPSIMAVTNYDHNGDGQPDGTSPMHDLHQDMANHATNGNWNGVKTVSSKLAPPVLISGHPQDHDLFYRGMKGAPDGVHPVDDVSDMMGRQQAVMAVGNSDPAIQQKLINAESNGASQRQTMAARHIAAIGGAQNLGKAAQNDQMTQQYMQARDQAVANGATPQQAQQQATTSVVNQSLAQKMDRLRAWYFDHGKDLPKELMPTEQERAYEAFKDAGYSEKDSKMMAFAQSIVAEQLRSRTSLQEANIHAGAEIEAARIHASEGGMLNQTLSVINTQLADPTITPERKQYLEGLRDATISGFAHQKDKQPRNPQIENTMDSMDSKGNVTHTRMQVIRAPDGSVYYKPIAEGPPAQSRPGLAPQPSPSPGGITPPNRPQPAAAASPPAPPQPQAAPHAGAPAPQRPATPGRVQRPMKGDTRNGYMFMGGDPNNPQDWKKI
jgi:hypothetical protein